MSRESTNELSAPADVPRIGLLRRWSRYLKERYPIAAHGALILSLYCSHQFLADAITKPDLPMRLDLTSLTGCFTLFCFFLHLRVFDDHKDYQEDCQHFPRRVLSRGVVNLSDLKLLAAAAIGVELTLSALRGPAALLSILLACFYSVLMLKEFFARQWLKRHFVTYASTHLLIVPLLSLVIFSFATGRYLWQAPAWYWLFAAAFLLAASDLDISRKIRAPADEIQGVDSYSKRFGVRGAAHAVLLVRITYTVLLTLIARHLKLPAWFFVALGLCFAVSLTAGVQNYIRPTHRTSRSLEMYAGLYVLACHILLPVALAVTRGIVF